MDVRTYLIFQGNCEEALEFYKRVFGVSAEFLMRYKDEPGTSIPTGWEEKIFHATVRFGDTSINLADAYSTGHTEFEGFGLLVHLDSETEAERVFSALIEGGEVSMPLQITFWARRYGVVQNKFGIIWKIQA